MLNFGDFFIGLGIFAVIAIISAVFLSSINKKINKVEEKASGH